LVKEDSSRATYAARRAGDKNALLFHDLLRNLSL
jgi:hypothetical protein